MRKSTTFAELTNKNPQDDFKRLNDQKGNYTKNTASRTTK